MTYASTQAGRRRPVVLVVDDHPAIPLLLRGFARQSGLTDIAFESVADADAARAWLAENRPDLVLLDSQLGLWGDFRSVLPDIAGCFDGPILLLTGAVPADLGKKPIDARLTGAHSKDDIGNGVLLDAIRRLCPAAN